MLDLRPERFVAGGDALAREPDGRVVFVRGGVPGDEAAVEITERKGDWARGVVVDVRVASPDRVAPPCPHRVRGCGGCDWQHIAVPAQHAGKTAIVVDALRRTARLPDAVVTVGPAVPAAGYRTTIRVVGGPDRRPGFREERSNAPVAVDGCLVAHPLLSELLADLRLTTGLEVTLRVSAMTGEMTALWDTAGGEVTGLPPAVATGPRAFIHERVAGHRLRVSAGSFFQSGPAAAELLVAAVKRAAPELAQARRVLDAYAGIGLLAATATSAVAELVAVETSSSAIDDCRANLHDRRAHIERRQMGTWRPPAKHRFDVAIADPARTGLGKAATAALVAAKAPVIVLVSCDPVSLARDATLLAAAGYRHDGTEVLDLFPHTHHVETVTRFVSGSPMAD
jgi:23S rRNA (uracil1939-C5)-methyltransferase